MKSPGHHTEVRALDLHVDVQYECSRGFVVAYSLELVYDHHTGVGHQQSWGGFCFPNMGVVTAGEACKGDILEGNTIVKGSIILLSSVHLVSAEVGLAWLGDRKLSELRRLLLLQQEAYPLSLAGHPVHVRVYLR